MKYYQILTYVTSMLKQPEYIAKEKISELEDTAIETKQNETQRKENHEPYL